MGYNDLPLEERGKIFIEKADKVHNGKYDYSRVVYVNSDTKVLIECPDHGGFLMRPANHLSGQGCKKCTKKIKDNEIFILRAKRVHKGRYDYSVTKYIGVKTKLDIICPIHGVFQQRPDTHLGGAGCFACHPKGPLTQETFIEKATKLYDGKYDYSKVEYVSGKKKVIIICPTHGEFEQTPSSHLSGRGCWSCKRSTGEEKVGKYLLDNNIEHVPQKYFLDCKLKYPLHFDFYLPEHNMCIEFDGEQHFKPICFNGDKTEEGLAATFAKVKLSDNTKNEYCEKKGIKMLRISYLEVNEIDSILDKVFQESYVL